MLVLDTKKIVSLILSIAIIIILLFKSLLISKVSVFLVLLSCLLLGRKEVSFVNPYYLFSFAPFSLLIYVNVASFYMLDLTHETYLLSVMNMSAFIFALSFTGSVKKILSCKSTNSLVTLVIHSIILYLLGLSANFIPSLASVLWVFSVAAIVCAMKTKKKTMLIFVALILASSMLGTVSKTAVLLNILTILITYERYYITNQRQRRRLLIYSFFAGLFMIFAFSFANKERGAYDADKGLKYYAGQGVKWDYSSTLFLPYMYLTTAWANVQYVTETQDTRTYGLWMVKPFIGYFGIDESFKEKYELVPKSSFNTFTFISCGFKDFGFWFSVIPSFFLGFFVKKVYSKFLVSESPFDVATYVIVGLAVAEMFFSNHFFMQSYPFTAFILMGVYKLLVSRI